MDVLTPEIIVPVAPNPTVESTGIVEAPAPTFSNTLDAGVILKLPCMVDADSS